MVGVAAIGCPWFTFFGCRHPQHQDKTNLINFAFKLLHTHHIVHRFVHRFCERTRRRLKERRPAPRLSNVTVSLIPFIIQQE
jgi:hypothetical protein